MSMRRFLAGGVAAVLVGTGGCRQELQTGDKAGAPAAAYFQSPKQAVTVITKLLEAKDWGALAKYYDLSGSGIDRATLESGEFFWRKERPAAAHPGGFWRYKHPFAPGFRYDDERPTDEAGVVVVSVKVEIDQGGGPPQRGFSRFLMKKHAAGWQVLPGKPK